MPKQPWPTSTSPEQAQHQLADHDKNADQTKEQLKAQDVWGFGMLALRMCSPGLADPYNTDVNGNITLKEDKEKLAYRWAATCL